MDHAASGEWAVSAFVGMFVGGDLLNQFHDAAPEPGVGDPCEGARQGQAFGRGEKVVDVRALFAQRLRGERQVFEEERHRDLQDVSDLLKPTRTDAVGTLLVFLNLLERNAEYVRDVLLSEVRG